MMNINPKRIIMDNYMIKQQVIIKFINIIFEVIINIIFKVIMDN
jgi:hypothetical protein